MDQVQERFEEFVIRDFADWHNAEHGTAYQYTGRPDAERPDGILRDNGLGEIPVEVGGGYYDARDAKMVWAPARGRSAPKNWRGRNPDEKLLAALTRVIAKKVELDYPPGTVLVLYVSPMVTTVADIERQLDELVIPDDHPFEAIYLAGHYPVSSADLGRAGYHVLRLDEPPK